MNTFIVIWTNAQGVEKTQGYADSIAADLAAQDLINKSAVTEVIVSEPKSRYVKSTVTKTNLG